MSLDLFGTALPRAAAGRGPAFSSRGHHPMRRLYFRAAHPQSVNKQGEKLRITISYHGTTYD